MKKIFAKLALFSFISVLLSFLLSANALAENPADLKETLKDVRETPCITLDEEQDDEGYIITFIEEPLDIREEENQDFIYRRCFRHTFQFTTPKTGKVAAKTVTQSFLSKGGENGATGCSQAAINLMNNPSDVEEYKVKYSCKEIQAILSRGGTALIYGYIGMVYKWGASVVGVVAVTVIILSGIQISASGGDPEAISKSKARIIQSFAGIAVLFLSGLILNTINPNFFTLS